MHGLSNMFVENKALVIGAAAVAFFVAAVLILLVFRLAFGRRLRMANNRARQMRLGIVDAFDLDRQRQLVIVRRDNVEHLVMIGGPNDILIESQIVRTEARSREKEPRDRDLTAAPATKILAAEPKVAIPPAPEPLQPAAAVSDEPAPPTRAPAPPPAGPLAGMTVGPRRAAPPPIQPKPAPAAVPPGAQAPAPVAPAPFAEPPAKASPPLRPAAVSPAAAPGPQPAGQPPVPGQGPVVPPPAGADQPAFLRWPARNPGAPLPGAAKPAAKTPGDLPPLPTPRTRQPQPAAPSTEPAFPPVPSMEGLESLEEEMAKLLGRGPGK